MFAQTTRVVAAPHGFACVGIPATWLYIPSFIEIRSGVSEPQCVKIWPFPLLWLFAFPTACTTVQAVTIAEVVQDDRADCFLHCVRLNIIDYRIDCAQLLQKVSQCFSTLFVTVFVDESSSTFLGKYVLAALELSRGAD